MPRPKTEARSLPGLSAAFCKGILSFVDDLTNVQNASDEVSFYSHSLFFLGRTKDLDPPHERGLVPKTLRLGTDHYFLGGGGGGGGG